LKTAAAERKPLKKSDLSAGTFLVDAHAHLDGYCELGSERLEAALEEIVRLRIFTISNSMDLSSYERNLTIAGRCPWVLPVFGIHPWNAHQYAGNLGVLADPLARSPLFGEIGLDHYFAKERSRYKAQRDVFETFLGAAKNQGKIIVVHTKGAEREVLDLLDRYSLPRVVIHWYSGPPDVFREMKERGFFFTVGCEVKHSRKIQTIAREVPADRLLTETDNPGGPRIYLKRPGTPSLVRDIVHSVAEARRLTDDDLARIVRANLVKLFSGDARLSAFLRKAVEARKRGQPKGDPGRQTC
jgi:TatD DNase family protein